MNRRVVMGPWGGGNSFFRAFHELAPKMPDVEVMVDQTMSINPEKMLLVGLENDGQDIGVEQAIMYKMYVKPDCKLVLRVNENDARKGTRGMDEKLVTASKYIDGTVFVSKWLQEYFKERGWACADQTVIINGVDQEIFKPQPKLDNGKLNIVAHHWSDNYMKGADIYEKLDELVGKQPDRFAFTYIGRHRCNFQHTTVVRPLAGKALGEELGKHDVYVSASRFDPGPNHILEALACGLPTWVHEDGGGCVEFAGAPHSYRNWDELHVVLNSFKGTPNEEAIKLTGWEPCVQQYVDYLRRI